VGAVEVDETRLVEITTKFPGYVDRLYADYVGKAVEEGSPLLDIYAPDLISAQEEILLARQLQATVGSVRLPGVSAAPVNIEAAARRRLSLWDIHDDQIDALLAEGRPSRTLSLRAPISGVVLDRNVVAGAAFDAGRTLLRLADLSVVWINVEIRETDAALVQPGSSASVELTAYPGERFQGAVDFIHPTADERTRAVRARVVIPNPEGRIRPGMYATVHVTTPGALALSVQRDAIVWTGESTLLFVAEDGGRIRPVTVEVGGTIGEYVVIRSGVESGQRVVASAQYLIDAEANIGAVMRSMMSMIGAGDMAEMDMGGMDMPGDSGMPGMRMPGDSGSASPNREGR
jgi:multidrug efflux pump subunit AcrA (membrane-fusion protein)